MAKQPKDQESKKSAAPAADASDSAYLDQGDVAGNVDVDQDDEQWSASDWVRYIVSDEEAMKEFCDAASKYTHQPSAMLGEDAKKMLAKALDELKDTEILRLPQPKQEVADRLFRLLGVGETCTYYPGADEKRDPLFAAVVGGNGEDALDLEVRMPDGSRVMRFGVLHVHADRLKREPQHRAVGGWDFADVAAIRTAELNAKRRAAQAKAAEDRKQRDAALRQQRIDETPRLLKLCETMTLEEAIRKLGPHWTLEQGMAAHRRSGQTPPREPIPV